MQTARMDSYEEITKLIGSAAKEYDHMQLEEAEANLHDYVAVALRVFERIEHDPDANKQFEALTASRRKLRMNEHDVADNSATKQ